MNSPQSQPPAAIDRIGNFRLQTPSEYFAEQKAKAEKLDELVNANVIVRCDAQDRADKLAERCEALEGALWGLKEAVRTAYLVGRINDVGYPTFRMDEADALLSGQPAPSPKADVNAALTEALTSLLAEYSGPQFSEVANKARAALAAAKL